MSHGCLYWVGGVEAGAVQELLNVGLLVHMHHAVDPRYTHPQVVMRFSHVGKFEPLVQPPSRPTINCLLLAHQEDIVHVQLYE